ncbi:MAG: hypothetical protein E7056_02075 [Lentisphaerae bacterium]|nr:hypothetical protein [Lentisphaerota bacterium]
MKKIFTAGAFLLLGSAVSYLCGGEFELKESGAIFSRQQPLISSSSFTMGSTELLEGKKGDIKRLDDGSIVFNRFSKERVPFREEIVVNGDGSEVEITFSMRVESDHEAVAGKKPLIYAVKLPWNIFENKKYHGVTGRVSSPKEISGECSKDFASGYKNMRTIVVGSDSKKDGLVLDFNPVGYADAISDYSGNCVRGIWSVTRKGNEIHCTIGITPDPYGAEFTGKLKIVRGDFATYRSRHALTRFSWGDSYLPQYLFSFGPGKAADHYTAVRAEAFSDSKKYGWISNKSAVPAAGAPEGAFYSALQGKDGKFRIAGMNPGLYIVTIGSGNYAGKSNKFTARVNGELFLQNESVKAGNAVTASGAVWVKDKLDVELSGDYLISTLGVQMLLADAEDVNVRRDFYRTRGFEPSVVFRNGLYNIPARFSAAREEFFLPEPGKEAAGAYREPARRVQVLDTKKYPAADWRYGAIISNFGPNNSGTLGEYPDDKELDKHLKFLKDNNSSVVISNGMLSRHTYYAHLDRAEKAVKRLTERAHKQGLRVMDHQDLTLLWNIDAGFRAAAENISQLQRMNINQLPSPYFCFTNKAFREHYFEYIKNFVRNTNVDSMMLDEVMFFQYCCTCAACREEFHKDTNWYIPVNEMDKSLNDNGHPLRRAFLNWRKVQVGNFFADLRKAIDEVKPDFSLVAYTTHYGYYSNYASFGNGSDLIEIARGADFLGTEITTRNQWRGARAVFALRKAKNLLRNAYNVPVWTLCGTNSTSYEVLYTAWAMSNMNGQSTWVNDDSRPKPGQGDFFALKENMDLKNAESAAQVALLFSARGRDWGRGLSSTSEILGTGQVLDTVHVPYDYIGEMNLNARQLAKYKVLMLGSCSALTDEEVAAIKEFMKNGGWVYANTTVGWEDGLGVRRKEWAFADVCDFDMKYSFNRPDSVIDPVSGKTVSFRSKLYNVPVSGVKDKSSRLWLKKDQPMILERNYGKGKFIYQTASMGLHLCAGEGYVSKKWEFEPDTALEGVFSNMMLAIVNEASAGRWQTNLPAGVLTTLYKNGNRWSIHLLNTRNNLLPKGEIVTYGVPADAFPPLEKDAVITLFDLEDVKQVRAVSPDFAGARNLEFKKNSTGGITLTLPVELLKVYTIIHIDCGEKKR